MSKKLWGRLVGDRGYLFQALFVQLFARGLQSVRPIRKSMQNRLVVFEDKPLTRKRFVIETIVDRLKNIPQIEHTRHRSTTTLTVKPNAGLIAYTWQLKKPSLRLSFSVTKTWLTCLPLSNSELGYRDSARKQAGGTGSRLTQPGIA